MEYVLYRYGTQSQYDSQSSYESNALYFIEDTHRIYKGNVLIADTADNIVFTSTAPEFASAEAGKLYVVSNESGLTLYVKGDTSMVEAGGQIKAGDISTIDAFADSILDKSGAELTADDTKIPTSGAVKSAISEAVQAYDGAFVDVAATRAEDNSGTLLTFTDKSGNTKDVTVADLFLTSVSYDKDTHKLSFVVKGQTEPVEVDLSDLVPQSVDASDVALAKEITVTTNVGNLNAGDKVIISGDPATGEVKAADVQALFEAILSKDVNPTAVQPSASITLTGAGAKEVGTQFTPSLTAKLNPGKYQVSGQSDQTSGVTASTYVITDSNSNTASTASGTFDAFTVDDETNYSVSATISYSDGVIPKTFLGNDYAAAQIKAGSKSANSGNVTGYRNCYWGYKDGTNALADPTSITIDQIKALGNSNRNKPTSIKTSKMQQIFIAVPAKLNSAVASIVNASTSLPQQLLTPFTVDIGGVNNYNPITYNVYYVANLLPEGGDSTFTITWN